MPNVVFSPALQAPIQLAPPPALFLIQGGGPLVVSQHSPAPGNAAIALTGGAPLLGLALAPPAAAALAVAGVGAVATPRNVTPRQPVAGAVALAGAAPGVGVTSSGGGLQYLWPDPLPFATVGAPYFYQLTASGGVAPYTFAVKAGFSLPPGLTLNSSTGVISGTPSAAQAITAETFTVTDSGP